MDINLIIQVIVYALVLAAAVAAVWTAIYVFSRRTKLKYTKLNVSVGSTRLEFEPGRPDPPLEKDVEEPDR